MSILTGERRRLFDYSDGDVEYILADDGLFYARTPQGCVELPWRKHRGSGKAWLPATREAFLTEVKGRIARGTFQLPCPANSKHLEESAAVAELWRTHAILVASSAKVVFTPTERVAVYYAVKNAGEDVFRTWSAEKWKRLRGIGERFLAKVTPLGWVVHIGDDVFQGRCRFVVASALGLDTAELTREKLHEAIRDHKLRVRGTRGYGDYAQREVYAWLGIPLPPKPPHPNGWKFNPFTGKPL
jgi:hypothetical protein